jgi:hypothetical protein
MEAIGAHPNLQLQLQTRRLCHPWKLCRRPGRVVVSPLYFYHPRHPARLIGSGGTGQVAEGALRAPRLAIRVLTGCRAESRRWLLSPLLFRLDTTHLTRGCETWKVLDLFFSVFHSGLLPKMGYFGVHYVTPVAVVGWCRRSQEYFGGLVQS